MNILVIIRPELFSIFVMLFLIIYDRYCSKYRTGKDIFFPFALVCLAHCVMALITEITVNTEGISGNLNDTCHILFFFFSLLYSLLFLDYALSFILPQGKRRNRLMFAGSIICLVFVIIMAASPISYLQGNGTKYSAGIGPTLCFGLGFLFFITADVIMVICRRKIARFTLFTVLPLSLITLGLLLAQILVPEFLFTAPALTITAVGLFFAIENPVNKFQQQAFTDAYLDIWNRNCYEYDLQHIVAERVRKQEPLIYMICDVNCLKQVNDSLSHRDGDRLLKETAEQLQKTLPSAYKVYRVGGDEFAAFFFDTDLNTAKEEIAAASAACSKIVMSPEIPPGISVGYTVLNPGESLDDLVRRADALMYENKRALYERSGYDRRRR